MPKLRFPEFESSPAWKEKLLVEEGEFLSSLTGKNGEDFGTGAATFITYMNVFTNTFVSSKALGLVDVKEGEKQNVVAVGDVLFTVSSETPEEVGMSSVLLEKLDNCYLNSFCVLFRFYKDKIPNSVFVGYLLRQSAVRQYFSKHAQGSTRFNLSKEIFRNLPIYIPATREQQKIADCLSSLDELITAQSQKLDTLKAHKKGLMQQLFPAEGETVPKLRFPEFRNAPEWEEKTLEQVATYENGKAHENNITENGQYIVVNSKFISTEGDIRKYSDDAFCTADVGDVLMVLSDVPNGRAIAKCYFVESDNLYTVNQRICRIKPTETIGKFLFYVLDRNPFFLAFDDGVKQTNLRKEDVLTCPMLLPSHPEEQQKIADCLSFLDDLIASQNQKLDTLKEHKKGLMQQLFPSVDEVNG